jgi:general secretion pathway protein L
MIFLRWWLQQLSALLPGGLAWIASGRGEAVVLRIDRGRAEMLVRRKGQTTRLAQAAADEAGFRELSATAASMEDLPHAVVMRFPPEMLLRKAVTFPSAARRNLDSLLGFEMDRETPFARDEVHWTYRVGRQDPASPRLDIDLLIVPRAYVDPTIETARGAGFRPNAIEIETEADEPALIRIGESDRWRRLRSDRRLMALATTAGALILLVIATPFIRQQLALASADRTIRLLTEQAHEAAALRQSVDQTASAISFINKERERDGSVVSALAITTRLIPDDSHLTSLSLRGGRLTIAGRSPSAAHLIDLLAQSPAFREPSFDSPVVQDDRDGQETFTISATLTRIPGS